MFELSNNFFPALSEQVIFHNGEITSNLSFEDHTVQKVYSNWMYTRKINGS